jgi:RNA polymerase sigma-70 factor (ECF subfamily)
MSPGRPDESFERLYNEHASGLLAFLTYQTGDRALAEDIVADTFERVLRTRSGWRGRSGEKTWLYSIALNRMRDIARRRGAEARAVASVPVRSGVDETAAVADRDQLHRAMLTLSEEERAVIALRFGGELTLEEIAELLEERQTTIVGRLYRGLRRLRDATE